MSRIADTAPGEYHSGLERKVAGQLQRNGLEVEFERAEIRYIQPARAHSYRPDFRLPNRIYVETKGVLSAADRQKHLLIREQHPNLDIRFVFYRSKQPLYPGSPITQADWCRTHGFKFADRSIPEEWFQE
jgi:Phage endonuclease I